MVRSLFLLFLTIFIVSACEQQKTYSKKIVESKLISIKKEDNNSQLKSLPNELETRYIVPKFYSCFLNNSKFLNPEILDNYSFDGTNRKLVDTIIPIEIAHKVLNDLKEKSATEKLSPENFWLKLDYIIAKELNEILLEQFINLDVFAYKKLQNLIAYAFTFYLEDLISLDNALTITFNEFGLNRKFTIAFSSYVHFVHNIPLCFEQELKEFTKIPNNLLTSNVITGYIKCKNDEYDLEIKSKYNKTLIINFKNHNFFREIFLRNLEVSHSKKTTEIRYQNKEVTIKLVLKKERMKDQYIDGTASELSYNIVDEFGKFKDSEIYCRTLKNLNLD